MSERPFDWAAEGRAAVLQTARKSANIVRRICGVPDGVVGGPGFAISNPKVDYREKESSVG
jgi:hypothetical protein